MNCKQGDLAIIVKSVAGNEGKIVQCLRLLPNYKCRTPDGSIITGPGWEIDQILPTWSGGPSDNFVEDCILRPLRGFPIEEMMEEAKFLILETTS